MAWVLVLLVLASLAVGGCSDSPPPAETPSPSATVPATAAPQIASSGAIRFTDVTAAAGIDFRHEAGAIGNKWYPETMGAGGALVDVDGDGWLDVILINGRYWPDDQRRPEPTMRLYRNQRDGSFRDVTAQSGLDISLYGMGVIAADYDNDGDQDLLITAYRETKLLRNQGDGTFVDVSEASGIAQGGWSTAAAFVDVDRDGWLDLVVGHYVEWEPASEQGLDCTYGMARKDYCAVTFFKGLGPTLYRNLGDGRFRDISLQAGLAAPEARVLGLAIVDFNTDGWPDVLVANDLTPSLLFANRGDGTFHEIGGPSGLVLDEGGIAFAGMGIDAAYVNNEAQLCVAIGNFAGQPTTLHCQAPAGPGYHANLFIEQSQHAGLARPTMRMVTFGLFFFDADLDGWQDLFLVNGHVADETRLRNVPYAQPLQLFRNLGNGQFVDVASEAASGLRMSLIGRAAAYGDYDNDGDADVLLTSNQGPAYLLRNDTPPAGQAVRLQLLGSRSNRDAIGARVRLTTSTRARQAMVASGGSYLAHSDRKLFFGLQPGEHPTRLEVTWPAGQTEVFDLPALDRLVVLREGAAQATAPQVSAAAPQVVVSTPQAAKLTAIEHYQAGRLAQALTVFQQALEQQPGDYIVQQYLIELYWRLGQQAQARTLLDSMAQTLGDANFLMQFAFHLEDVNLLELANAVYHLAARFDPQAPEALYRLGKNALEARRYDAAVGYFQQALERREELITARQGLGLALAGLGRLNEAVVQWRQVIRQTPEAPEAYTQLGALYTRQGRLTEALEAYRMVVRLQPEHPQGYHNLGVILAAQQMPAPAEEQFRAALQRDPHYLPAHNDLGTLYAEQGELQRAIAAFQAALRSDATLPEAHYLLGLAYAQLGQADAMLAALQQSVQLNDAYAPAHNALASIYYQRQQYDLAWQHASRAAQLGAPAAELLQTLRQRRAAPR